MTHTVFGFSAAADNQLVITENSSTSLTATYNGSTSGVTVTFVSPGLWTLSIPANFGDVGTQAWFEPGSTTQSNVFDFSLGALTVSSENAFTFNAVPDGTTVPGLVFGGGSGLIDVTIHDLGDTAKAPDTGTTGSLLGLSLMGLAFLRRKLC